jgi:uncharacterized membrane protein
MSATPIKAWVRAFGLGTAAGLRSTMAPALLSRAAARGDLEGIEDTAFARVASGKISKLLTLLAAGEVLADKTLPLPARTSGRVLLGRVGSGALVGAALFASEKRAGALGATLGAAGAVTGAYAGEALRQRVGERLGVSDPTLALLEDVAAVTAGLLALRSW